MMLRLFLAMLLALFAAPAMAQPCHDDAQGPVPARLVMAAHAAHHTPAGQHHHRQPRQDQAALHACIGCVPPSSLRTAAVPAAPLLPPLPRAIVIDAFVAGLSMPPALPPPRLG